MKKIRFLVLCVILTLMFSLPALAASKPRLVDQEGLLSESEAFQLTDKLDEISATQDCDVIVVTTPSLDGLNVQDYADNFYDDNGYGMGSQKDGVLLLIAMNEREYAISTCGYGMTAFTTAGMQYMEDQFVPLLSKGKYYDSFEKFADLSDDFITEAKKGTPYDTGHLPKKKKPFGLYAIISAIIGAIGSMMSNGQKQSALKSVAKQRYARSYVTEKNLTTKEDLFLYHNIVRTPIQKEERSGSSGNGAHVSSSGTTHGGSSGKF